LYYASTPGVGPDTAAELADQDAVWDKLMIQRVCRWCLAIIELQRDGKTGAFTKADETPSEAGSRGEWSNGYGVAVNPIDGSVLVCGLGQSVPGRFSAWKSARTAGTCKTEVYEPPFD